MKRVTLLILLMALCVSCSKSDDFDAAVHAEIASPYLEGVLIDLGIDGDGKINRQVLKKDIESVTELNMVFNLSKNSETCEGKYDYDLEKENLLAGLENFTNLKKLVFTVQPNFNEDGTNFEIHYSSECSAREDTKVLASIEKMDKLEEFYFGDRLGFGYGPLYLEIIDCPLLRKIGTSNVTQGIKEYPSDSIIQIDKSNFFEPNPSYDKFYAFKGTDDSSHASQFYYWAGTRPNVVLKDLPELESLHFYQMYFSEVKVTSCPQLKKLFLFKKQLDFTSDYFLFSPTFRDLEELYIDYNYYTPFPDSDRSRTLDLSGFPNLNKLYYKFLVQGGDRNEIPEGSKLNIRNGTNLQNDLKITLDYRNYGSAYLQGDSRNLAFCLDDNITEDYKNNIIIKSPQGDEGAEAVTFSCD